MNISVNACLTPIQNGTILDSTYLLLDKLGDGQYAKFNLLRVKLARDLRDDALVAIKIWKRNISINDSLKNFMNEIFVLHSLNNKYIVNIFFVSYNGIYVKSNGKKITNVIYYVMQYAKCGELFRIIKETGKLSENLSKYLFLQLIQGLLKKELNT